MANHLESLRGNPQGSPDNLGDPKPSRRSVVDFIPKGQDPNTLEILGNPSSSTIALLREGGISKRNIIRYFDEEGVSPEVISRLLSDPKRHDLLVSDVQTDIVEPQQRKIEEQKIIARNLLGGARAIMISQRHLIRKARVEDEPVKSEEDSFIEEYLEDGVFREQFEQGANSAKAIGTVKRVLRLGIEDFPVEYRSKAGSMSKVLQVELGTNVDPGRLEKLFEGEHQELWPKEEMVWRIMELIDPKDITENPGKAWKEVSDGLEFIVILVGVAYAAQEMVGAKRTAKDYTKN